AVLDIFFWRAGLFYADAFSFLIQVCHDGVGRDLRHSRGVACARNKELYKATESPLIRVAHLDVSGFKPRRGCPCSLERVTPIHDQSKRTIAWATSVRCVGPDQACLCR